MFTMMNTERLSVGIQGLGVAEVAYQNAVTYARERLQGRSLTGAKYPEKPADPIIVHPDVRRMLLTMRAYIEGCRALSGWVAREIDILHRSTDDDAKLVADDFTALLTPVVKALFTDLGFEIASTAHAMLWRPWLHPRPRHGAICPRCAHLHDLRGHQRRPGARPCRPQTAAGWRAPAHALPRPRAGISGREHDDEEMEAFIAPLQTALEHLQIATGHVMEAGMSNYDEIGAASVDYLRLFGLVALGFMWARMAKIALPKAEAPFYKAKIDTAKFFMQRLLPQTASLLAAIQSGSEVMMEFEDAAF